MAEVIEEQQKQSEPSHKKSHTALWFGIFTTLMIVALAGGGFYLLQQFRAAQDTENSQDEQKLLELDKSLNGLQNQLSTLQSQIANFNAEINAQDSRLSQAISDFGKQQDEKLVNTRQDLETSIAHLQRQLGKTRSDWLIADAEYLLSVAAQRLHLTGDINTSKAALEAADERLKESGDPSMFKIREQITKEIASLSKLTVPDVVGMYATLQLIKDQAQTLEVLLPHLGKQLTPAEQKITSNEQVLAEQGHDILQIVGKQLEGYVTIRHTEQPVNAVLTPEQVAFIKEQLGVKLEMIKIALVEQNEAMFQSSLNDAKQWLKTHFIETKDTQRLLAELDKLSQVHLRSQFPDISGSLKMLKDVGKLRLDADKAALNAEPAPAAAAEPAPVAPQPAAVAAP